MHLISKGQSVAHLSDQISLFAFLKDSLSLQIDYCFDLWQLHFSLLKHSFHVLNHGFEFHFCLGKKLLQGAGLFEHMYNVSKYASSQRG